MDHTAVDVEIAPLRMQYFAQASAGHNQKANCSNRKWIGDRAAVLGLRRAVLGLWLRPVRLPGQALGLGQAQRIPEAAKLREIR